MELELLIMELKSVLVRSEYDPDSSSVSNEVLFAVMVLFRVAAEAGVAAVQ
jgi:hypothetical protein